MRLKGGHVMRVIERALLATAFIVAFPALPQLQTATAKPVSRSGWLLTKQVDKFKDTEELTLVLRSNEGSSSLRIHCGGAYTVYLTFPKSVELTDLTIAEIRFDKNEPLGITLRRFDEDFLVDSIGGSKTEANFVAMTDDARKAVTGEFSADETSRVGMNLVKTIASSSRMIYRLSLAKAAARGTQATFNLTGFAQASGPLAKKCPSQ
jgi:hypothetical protein